MNDVVRVVGVFRKFPPEAEFDKAMVSVRAGSLWEDAAPDEGGV